MNKQELSIVVLLFAILIGWSVLQQRSARPQAEPPVRAQDAHQSRFAESPEADEEFAPPVLPEAERLPDAVQQDAALEAPVVRAEEERLALDNGNARLEITSWGGGIVGVELSRYRETVDPGSGPVVLDFSERPALSIVDWPAFSAQSDFSVAASQDGLESRAERRTADGLRLERSVRLSDEGYVIDVADVIVNERDTAAVLPGYGLAMGAMRNIESSSSRNAAIAYLGIDALPDESGRGVQHLGKKMLPALFGHRRSAFGCGGQNVAGMPERVAHRLDGPVVWIAAKNKFFVQILDPLSDGVTASLHASRATDDPRQFLLTSVSADVLYPEVTLAPGESLRREARYYVGPKRLARLRDLGKKQADVMQFGWWEWFRGLCSALVWVLNVLHGVVRNYGVAIILLTVIVKFLFWPVTRKSTESMRKMQEIQPLVAKLREKYQGKPQKLQQETMALYREHKVNPMMGCLPMVVQIPVFIALFTVLRSAVELRFAPFLWIRDLSEPENLLADVLPIPLNILPLLMTATTLLQQKLTPSGGDPQQQKMMMIMPVFMLFIFYSMPSALVLYWTTSQALAIVQLVRQNRSRGGSPPAAPAAKSIGKRDRKTARA